jgi:hypothetical protein
LISEVEIVRTVRAVRDMPIPKTAAHRDIDDQL